MEGFKIFNASAGSGKTYQLTKYYLKLLLSNIHAQRFRRILALTFTNKAVAEMKERILDSLSLFGDTKISKAENALFLELQKELSLSQEELEKKCATTLKLLLHNYDFFEVSTIDKFMHRVIKTFAKDLKITQSFEVELDSDLLLDEAISRLLQNISGNKALQKILIDFALEKVEASKSWNIIYDLKEIGKLLFYENHYYHVHALKDKSLKDFNELKVFLKSETETISRNIIACANNVLELIQANQLEFSDFTGQRFPKFMLSLQSGNQKVDFKAAWKQNFDTAPLYNKSSPEPIKTLIDGLQPKFSKWFNDIKNAFNTLSFFKNAYNNLLPLTILNEIAKEISNLQGEKGILHISQFNKLISNEIAHQPVPYIYERLGERYRHYFIDEFQDTSRMQWHNLIPLIGNALETEDIDGEKGSLMIVGDVKQSIYRWRGGDPEQFLRLNDFSKGPFSVSPEVHLLETNWRSFSRVVDFNNDFFFFASRHLNEAHYNTLYQEQTQQKTNQKKGGYIEINFAPKNVNHIELYYCEIVLNTILGIVEKGHSYGDICILVRKNKQGVILADYLAEHDIPLISSEALLLQNNTEVHFLVNLLRFLDQPSEKLLQFELLEYLFAHRDDKHDSIVEILGDLPKFLETHYSYFVEEEVNLPLLHILERAIIAFKMMPKCGAHVIHFLDVALEYSQKQNLSLHGFLNYWSIKKSRLAISPPNHQNAVQMMSIHKSKGLEFRFVIFPFADDKINSRLHEQKVWVPLQNIEDSFQEVLVNATKDLEKYSQHSSTVYHTENNLSQLDDFNVLYVALTRAVEGLFIFTKSSRNNSYGKLFEGYLCHKNLWNTENERFTFGEFPSGSMVVPEEKTTTPIPYTYTQSQNAPELVLTSQSLWNEEKEESKKWGTLIHSILAEIKVKDDVGNAVQNALNKGDLEPTMREEVESLLFNIVEQPLLSEFYTNQVKVLNEVELLDVNGVIHRPDRLVMKGNNIILIDYKTGIARPEHKTQLEVYANLIHELETRLIVDQKILVYIGDAIKPVFI